MHVLLPLMLHGFLSVGAAWAGPPPSQSTTLVLCPREEICPEALAWLDGLPALDGAPLQLAEAVLELDTGSWEGGEPLGEVFAESLAKARDAIERRRYETADGALQDAERALDRWGGHASNQDLVDLWLLRGVVRTRQDRARSAEASFQRAAALAWNRTVTLPVQDEATARAWDEAQRALLAQPTGRLRLAGAAPGMELQLDGVPLGPPPLEVVVFPGQHRLTASDARHEATWKRDLTVLSNHTTTVVASFGQAGDARWVVAQLEAALLGTPPPTEVLDLLSEWAARRGIRRIRLVVAEPVDLETEPPVWELHELDYDPLLRRLSDPEQARP